MNNQRGETPLNRDAWFPVSEKYVVAYGHLNQGLDYALYAMHITLARNPNSPEMQLIKDAIELAEGQLAKARELVAPKSIFQNQEQRP